MKLLANNYKPKDVCRIIREYTGLTQEEFGKSIHKTDRTIRLWESGKSSVSLETLLTIAKTHQIKITIEQETKHK